MLSSLRLNRIAVTYRGACSRSPWTQSSGVSVLGDRVSAPSRAVSLRASASNDASSNSAAAAADSSSSLLSSFMQKYSDSDGSPKDPPPTPRPITRDDVAIQFARSSGAGGQNVNKVNTKVDMRLRLSGASSAAGFLDRQIIAALRVRQKNRINGSDELVVTSQRTRSQLGNIEDALVKMQEIIDDAYSSCLPVVEDREKKAAVKKQLDKGNKKRLEAKKQRSEKKKDRKSGKNIKDW
jgi:peptidyl-tRNA hydrolase ICT1